ncbi:unnamed protein product [Darwinula stevensoni]|uniref:C2 domain-containing protein n=1 Tax=Darwinula stevensoni TaxID=69355 RepID=A0A7R9AIX7_9CRUS|nr:unnamed protein product [Darwinula stevensoni]CAG0906507.1 unnamed protein product [Darwinula stevensoni]
MSLLVKAVKAANLPDIETFGKIDPYVEVDFQGQSGRPPPGRSRKGNSCGNRFRREKKKTTVKKQTCDPEWGEDVEFDLGGKPPPPEACLDVYVKDYEKIGRNR